MTFKLSRNLLHGLEVHKGSELSAIEKEGVYLHLLWTREDRQTAKKVTSLNFDSMSDV